MKTETITWHELPKDGMPDAETTVLVAFVRPNEPAAPSDTWPGWWSGEHWIDAGTGDHIERDAAARVTAWADMPAGIGAC